MNWVIFFEAAFSASEILCSSSQSQINRRNWSEIWPRENWPHPIWYCSWSAKSKGDERLASDPSIYTPMWSCRSVTTSLNFEMVSHIFTVSAWMVAHREYAMHWNRCEVVSCWEQNGNVWISWGFLCLTISALASHPCRYLVIAGPQFVYINAAFWKLLQSIQSHSWCKAYFSSKYLRYTSTAGKSCRCFL